MSEPIGFHGSMDEFFRMLTGQARAQAASDTAVTAITDQLAVEYELLAARARDADAELAAAGDDPPLPLAAAALIRHGLAASVAQKLSRKLSHSPQSVEMRAQCHEHKAAANRLIAVLGNAVKPRRPHSDGDN